MKGHRSIKRIAANQVEFHKGHSQLVEFLVAGSARLFHLLCAPFSAAHEEGADSAAAHRRVGEVGGAVSILRGGPHPNALCSGPLGISPKKANASMLRPAKLQLTPTSSL
jgi:hypothetical protein